MLKKWGIFLLEIKYFLPLQRETSITGSSMPTQERYINPYTDDARAEGAQQEKMQSARKMKDLGMPIEVISQVTGLTPQEIEELG